MWSFKPLVAGRVGSTVVWVRNANAQGTNMARKTVSRKVLARGKKTRSVNQRRPSKPRKNGTPNAPMPKPCRARKYPTWAPRLPKMLWQASSSSVSPAFLMMRMSTAPVKREEITERVRIKDRPRANRPATERVRSSDQVSWACVTNAKLKRDVSLGALFLRLDLVALPFLGASWSLRRMFLAMDSTNLNARRTWELWLSNASSLKGVKKGVALNHGIRYLCPPNS